MPAPGDFGVCATNDLGGRIIRWATRSTVNHAFIVVSSTTVLEARPSGAGLQHTDRYPRAIYSNMGLTDEQRQAIVRHALALQGTPYSWLDIAALGFHLVTGRHAPGWVLARIERADRLICSQLVDMVYERAGVHLFDDGRLHGSVTPGDLLSLIAR